MSLSFSNDKYRNNQNTPWASAMEARLIELWAKGSSASNIAVFLGNEFKIKVTRNAVIGKAHRIALPHRKKQRACTDPATIAQRRQHRSEYQAKWRAGNRDRINTYAKKYYARVRQREESPSISLVEDYAIPTPQRKTIYELQEHSCRWPVGEPKSDQFFFCGADAEKDRPYCSSHCQRAYVEIRPR